MIEAVRDYAILMLDPNGYVATWNAGAERFKGYAASEIIGRHFSAFYPEDDIAARKPERHLAVAALEGRVEDEGWRVRRDGSRFWANVVITALRDPDGALRGYGKITRDLTERRDYEDRLEYIADHDALTGVGNRRSFNRELGNHVERVARYGAAGALLMIDLDNFKCYNDLRGHAAGDRLIVRIAHGLRSRLRESDVFARLGGDEFAVLLPHADERAAERVAESLLQIVRSEAALEQAGTGRQITASIGIAFCTGASVASAERLMGDADIAMYDAKGAGRDRWSRYRPEATFTSDRD